MSSKHVKTATAADNGSEIQKAEWNDWHVIVRLLSADFSLPDGNAWLFPEYFEIASGVTLDIGNDSLLEVV